MENEFILSQVKSLKSVVASHWKQAHDKSITIQDVYMCPELVMHQLDALEEVMNDSVILYEGGCDRDKFIMTTTDFSLYQLSRIKLALEDSAKIQHAPHCTTVQLATVCPEFALALARSLEEVIQNNSAVMQDNTDLNKLCMSQPVFVTKLAGWVHQLMYAHVSLLAQFATLNGTHIPTNRALGQSGQEIGHPANNGEPANMRITGLETSIAELHQALMLANEALKTKEGALSKVKSELEALLSASAAYEHKLEERDQEIVNLKEECKKLIRMHNDATEAALSAAQTSIVRDEEHNSRCHQLSAELTEVKLTYNADQCLRAQEHDRLTAELAELKVQNSTLEQLEENLRKEVGELQSQLNTSEIQCESLKLTVDDMLSRHTAELDAVRRAAAVEREEYEVATNKLLQSTSQKIEELEIKFQSLVEELPKARGTVSASSFRKRKATGRDNNTSSQDTTTVDLAAHCSPIPLARLEELNNLSEIAVDLGSPDAVPAIFTRQSLSNILGGSVQGLVVRCTESATDLARRYSIQDYLCPNMDHNAWSPAGPGKHGYMQVGLGRDRKLFNDQGEYRHVFVGAGKLFIYCGWYHVLRVEALTEDEWKTLPDQVKFTYSETTVNKEKSDKFRSATQVLAKYNSGEIRAPCVRLQCTGFDSVFYQELVRANDQFYSNKPRPGLLRDSAKRRRVGEQHICKSTPEQIATDSSVDAGPSAHSSGCLPPGNETASQDSPCKPEVDQQEESISARRTLRIPRRRQTRLYERLLDEVAWDGTDASDDDYLYLNKD